MDRKRAIEITNDRLESLEQFIPSNESEKKTAKETREYLEFVKKILSKTVAYLEQMRQG